MSFEWIEDNKLQFLRCIDKLDRLGKDGVKQLLTTGRRDKSGDFTEGLGLTDNQAELILWSMCPPEGSQLKGLERLEIFFAICSLSKEDLDKLNEFLK